MEGVSDVDKMGFKEILGLLVKVFALSRWIGECMIKIRVIQDAFFHQKRKMNICGIET